MKAISDYVKSRYLGEPLDGPLHVEAIFYIERPKSRKKDLAPDAKPDLDNCMKLLGDALEGVLWVNDSRIVDLRLSKRYAPLGEFGHIELLVTNFPPALDNVNLWMGK